MTCIGHSDPNDSQNYCGCNGHTALIDNDTCSCNAHDGTGNNDSGYVGPTTISFTNVTVSTGEKIDLQNEIHELLDKLNAESTRRAVLGDSTTDAFTLTNPVSQTHIRRIRNLYMDVLNVSATSPYTDSDIITTQTMKATTIEAMKDGLVADAGSCVCDCNYACTCNCNYCTCNCNYACTCDCNHACQCNCNYACTCDCNHACICNCNYSDIRLKTEIIYF